MMTTLLDCRELQRCERKGSRMSLPNETLEFQREMRDGGERPKILRIERRTSSLATSRTDILPRLAPRYRAGLRQ